MKAIEIVGQKFLAVSLSFYLGILIALLISGCSSSPLPPVERIVIQKEVIRTAAQPPRRPDQIAASDFDHFEVITQSNIDEILKDVENGERDPLDHVMLGYGYYTNLATWMKGVENYIISAEQYFKQVEDDYDKVNERKD